MSTTTELMTAEEFYEFANRPDNAGRSLELVRGEVIEQPLGDRLHGVVCSNAGYLIGLHVRQKNQGRLLGGGAGVILRRDPDTVRGIDLAYFETSRRFVDLNPRFSEEIPAVAV